MNVDRLTSGVSRVPVGPRTVDLTVTDRGVTGARPEAVAVSRPEAVRPPVAPAAPLVTSTPKLQALLSTAETQALREAFVARPTAVAPPASPVVYSLRGTAGDQQVRAAVGGLMDFTG